MQRSIVGLAVGRENTVTLPPSRPGDVDEHGLVLEYPEPFRVEVIDPLLQFLQLVVKSCDRFGWFLQHRVSKLHDGIDH